MELFETIETIKSKKDFCVFLELLKCDYRGNVQDWENVTLPDFFEAISAWLMDTDENVDFERLDKPTWSTLAAILYSGKIYE